MIKSLWDAEKEGKEGTEASDVDSGPRGLQFSWAQLPPGKTAGALRGQVTVDGFREEAGSLVVFSSQQHLHVGLKDPFPHRVLTLDSPGWPDPLDRGRDSHLPC